VPLELGQVINQESGKIVDEDNHHGKKNGEDIANRLFWQVSFTLVSLCYFIFLFPSDISDKVTLTLIDGQQ
jgi:hypothetical protein